MLPDHIERIIPIIAGISVFERFVVAIPVLPEIHVIAAEFMMPGRFILPIPFEIEKTSGYIIFKALKKTKKTVTITASAGGATGTVKIKVKTK